ncbi:hypothetical protein [Marinobacter alkaliphilus]|uniref:RES domain-containing protein n=1 Tax=Marinobacter alkaliphilus TaxID=254719 RepID=A0ABZ3EAU7_9GAMM
MSANEPKVAGITKKPVYRATLKSLSDSAPNAAQSALLSYVRLDLLVPNLRAVDLPPLTSPFHLRQQSIFGDGSFPIAYYCDSLDGAIDSLAQRIMDMLPLYADADLESSGVVIIEAVLSGDFLDITGEDGAGFLDPMGDWQNFGRSVKADSSFDGILFSDEDSCDNPHTWFAVFDSSSLAATPPRAYPYSLSITDGEASWQRL